ncbi:MAG: thioredoxin domain-containing protein [Gemmatimonadaceae bacterium]
MPNRLATESSPYLRQHADNPVNWYPWGAEAFAQAAQENKPVLLSVGYAACHWCHVMAHESFEDAETAALMNQLFINVKVDREERPDVDSIYMQAVQAMVGQGGWPMTVALTPTGEPFWGGTYFPTIDQPGRPSFKRVLATLGDAWKTRRESVERTAQAMRELYANAATPATPSGPLSPELLERAFATLARQHDSVLGGFGGAPKFPQTMSLDFCLRWWARSGNTTARDIAHNSFLAMARGGIYDQVGGGFHRYSVDAEWLVPHFEKMLYDNALLVRFGAHLWQATGDDEVARIVEETIAWLLREMTSSDGGFYASLDADSEGHEGTFYVWSAAELDALLGADAEMLKRVWGVTVEGNFEERNILHLPKPLHEIAAALNIDVNLLRNQVTRAAQHLYDVRKTREWPSRDDKVLAGWNGLMTRALAEAGRVFNRADWIQAAVRNGEFLRRTFVRDGRVMRVHMDGITKVAGFLEDHAAVALAFIGLHEATADPVWLDDARQIAKATHAHFRDTSTGTWYDTADDAEALITRPHDVFDNAVPAGPSLAQELMLRLAEVDGATAWTTETVAQLAVQAEPMARWPNGFGHLLGVTDMALFGGVAIAILGDPSASDFQALARTVAAAYVPTLVLVSGREGEDSGALLANRSALGGKATAYLCRGFVCEAPTSDPNELEQQLLSLRGTK